MGESPASNILYYGQVQLKPFDQSPYLQLTNVSGGIYIEDYQLFVVDCYGNEFDATESLNIKPFIDSDNIGQVAIELIYIGKDFGKEPVYLRIDQANSDSWYSNLILITNHGIEFTSRIDYRHNNRYYGTDYPILNLYQSTRLQFYYNDFVSKSESKNYHQISTGQNVSVRASLSSLNEYVSSQFNGWTNKRFEKALNSDEFYIDLVRNEPFEGYVPESREGDSNISETKFLTDPDENNIYNPVFQVAEGLQVVILNPLNNALVQLTVAVTLSEVIITFNQDVTILNLSGILRRPISSDVILNNTNTSVLGSDLIIDTTGLFIDIGAYEIVINGNSIKGNKYGEIWSGIFDYKINVMSGDYSGDYDGSDYFLT